MPLWVKKKPTNYKLQLVLSEMLLILQTSCLKETTLMELIRSLVSELIALIDLLF